MYRFKTLQAVVFGALLGAGLLLAGCSDDSAPAADTLVVKDSGVKDAAGKEAAADMASPDMGVAPSKLVRDKGTVCPTAFQSTAPAAGKNTGFMVESQQRTFYLLLPDSAQFSGPRPLMVYFHGTGGSAEEIVNGKKTWGETLTKKGFIVAGPQGEDNGTVWPEWDAMRTAAEKNLPNKDMKFFDTLVDCLAGHFSVDANRVYISGHSAGGIMSNRVLRERSKLLAGGVVASGVFDLTDPVTPGPLSPLAVMVTWGGDNDEYSGSSGGKQVPKINFVEQAAVASKHYETASGLDQIHCKGDNLGHKWLAAVEDLMVDYLLSHPLGMTVNKAWKLTAPASSTKVTCSEDAAVYVPKVTVTCTKNTLADCQTYCQSVGDCVVENGSVSPILSAEIAVLGFTGTNYGECKGCITACEADVAKGGAVDTAVLACYKTESSKASCGSGLTAALAVADYVNKCCDKQTTSQVCGRLCTAVMKNTVAAGFFTACTPWK